MQKWLDDQATLVSGARVRPTPLVHRPAVKSRSLSKQSGRSHKTRECVCIQLEILKPIEYI